VYRSAAGSTGATARHAAAKSKPAGGLDGVERRLGVDVEHVLEVGAVAVQGRHRPGEGVFGDEHACVGVGEHVGVGGRGRRDVQRDADGAEVDRGRVDERGLRPRAEQEPDRVAAAHPQRRQRTRQPAHALAVLAPGDADAVPGRAQRDPIGVRTDGGLEGFAQRAVRGRRGGRSVERGRGGGGRGHGCDRAGCAARSHP
jgi:hypothetical protein